MANRRTARGCESADTTGHTRRPARHRRQTDRLRPVTEAHERVGVNAPELDASHHVEMTALRDVASAPAALQPRSRWTTSRRPVWRRRRCCDSSTASVVGTSAEMPPFPGYGGVDGSSPSEALQKPPHQPPSCSDPLGQAPNGRWAVYGRFRSREAASGHSGRPAAAGYRRSRLLMSQARRATRRRIGSATVGPMPAIPTASSRRPSRTVPPRRVPCANERIAWNAAWS
jgi:hypothetical protein